MANTILVIPLANSNSAGLLYANPTESGLVTNTSGIFINANTGLIVNSSGVFGTTIIANDGIISNTSGIFINANTGLIVNSLGVYVDFSSYSNTLQMNNNLANYQTIAGLFSSVATLTANNTSFVGSVTAANVVSNAQLQANISAVVAGDLSGTYQTIAGLVSNVATLTANNTSFVGTVTAANVVSNAQLSANLGNYPNNTQLTSNLGNYPNNTQLSSNLGNYQTTAGLASNVAKLIANNTQYVGTIPVGNVVSDVQLSSNLGNYPNNTQLTNNLNNYQTTAGLSANIATLTANNTSFVGSITAANVVSNAQLVANLGNLPLFSSTVNGAVKNSGGGTTNFLRADGTWIAPPGAAANPSGANTQLQYNLSGSFGADANLTWNYTTLMIGNASVNATINSTTFSGTANNATNLGGTAASGYQTTAGLSANVIKMTANDVAYLGGVVAASYINTSAAYTITGVHTYGNLTINSIINSTAHTIGTINATAVGVSLANNLITIGNSSVNTTINSTTFSGTSLTANNATNLGGTAAAGYQTTAGLSTNVATLTANSASYIGSLIAVNVVSNAQLSGNISAYQTSAGLNANVDAHLPNYTGSLNAISVSVGNSSINTTINSTSLIVAQSIDSISVSCTSIIVGNSSVNNVINSTAFMIGNIGSSIVTTCTAITVGNSTINTVINNYSVLIGTINSTAVGVSLANNLITIGNSTVNVTSNSSTIKISNSSATIFSVNSTGVMTGNGAGLTSLPVIKSFGVLSPLAADMYTLFWTNSALTIAQITTVITNTTAAWVNTNFYYGTTLGTGTSILLSNTANSTIGVVTAQGSLGNSGYIPASTFVWCNVNGVSSVTSFHATFSFV